MSAAPRAFRLALLAAALVLSGCAFLGQQVRITSASQCISKTCASESDAVAYDRCASECRQTYGP